MPDYSKTQIYKIVSKDSNINNFYIGSTTNWTKRKYRHKTNCNNEKSRNYNLQIYQIIRSNGGFENFNMILIEDYPCKNKRESEKREQYWKDSLKPDMNMINAYTMDIIDKNDPEYNKERYQKYKDTNIKRVKEYHQKELIKNVNYYKEKYQKYNYKVTCECGSEIAHCEISKHKKTLKHIAYIESLNHDQPPTNSKITV